MLMVLTIKAIYLYSKMIMTFLWLCSFVYYWNYALLISWFVLISFHFTLKQEWVSSTIMSITSGAFPDGPLQDGYWLVLLSGGDNVTNSSHFLMKNHFWLMCEHFITKVSEASWKCSFWDLHDHWACGSDDTGQLFIMTGCSGSRKKLWQVLDGS